MSEPPTSSKCAKCSHWYGIHSAGELGPCLFTPCTCESFERESTPVSKTGFDYGLVARNKIAQTDEIWLGAKCADCGHYRGNHASADHGQCLHGVSEDGWEKKCTCSAFKESVWTTAEPKPTDYTTCENCRHPVLTHKLLESGRMKCHGMKTAQGGCGCGRLTIAGKMYGPDPFTPQALADELLANPQPVVRTPRLPDYPYSDVGSLPSNQDRNGVRFDEPCVCGHYRGEHDGTRNKCETQRVDQCDCPGFQKHPEPEPPVLQRSEICTNPECGHHRDDHVGFASWCVEDNNDPTVGGVCPCMKFSTAAR